MRTADRPLLLRRAFEDVRAQKYEDWELIVVNDGGRPGPVDQLAAEVFGADERVRIVHNEQPTGRWPAANAGVRAAAAPLLVIHDDDDTWSPDFLAVTTEYLDRHPEVAGVAGRIEIVWERIDSDTIVETGRTIFEPDAADLLLYDQLMYNRWVPISFLYRAELHDRLGPFRDDLAVVGDWDFNTRLLRDHRVGFLPERPLAFWHQRPGALGPEGNSVIAEDSNHRRFDRLLREEHLRAWTDANGLGLPLFIAQHFREQEQRIGELHRALDDMNRRFDELAGKLDAALDTTVDVQQRMIASGLKQRVKRGLRRGRE